MTSDFTTKSFEITIAADSKNVCSFKVLNPNKISLALDSNNGVVASIFKSDFSETAVLENLTEFYFQVQNSSTLSLVRKEISVTVENCTEKN